MIAYGMLVVLALFMRFGPDIPFRRMLNTHLVERPLEILLAHRRHQYIFWIIAPFVLLLGGEATLILGPELMLGAAADMALYIDVVVVAAASASWSRARSVLARWKPRFGRRPADRRILSQRRATGATSRAKRTQRAPAALTKANDDDAERPDAQFVAVVRPFAMAA
ncbi:hypothetical protein [Alteriqipengyuania lutimaris]|uniref:Uncharacterized protein n=1 Tax=Alteriqipengyuania lutimaris TaxID=1538146 RepID=A0A395LLU3_9SPHN|nr:hypothetical protein [Alteriqipengyuania lutimaris]MBB3033650.1 hypothetical protein [Alteriqipengyuania lutimaris]RDS77357.1 hypothetical protein DL238_06845 [Alteriqipengyuania lutimaris]